MKSKMRKLISVLVVAFLLFSVTTLTAPKIVQGSSGSSPTYYTINEDPSPVFNTLIPDQAYVIKDNVGYKLYYAGNDFGSINLATSPDGINWAPYAGNPVLSEGLTVQAEHANVKFYSTGFVGANSGTNPSAMTMYYRMWYQGTTSGIGGWRYAESPDGINWYNHIAVTQTGTPVFSAATGTDYGIADVVYTPGGEGGDPNKTFRIYANVQWELGLYGAKELVVMAYSANGYVWTGYDPTSVGYATPVFEGTLDGTSFDTDHIGWFKVIENSPTDWQAFYSGGDGTTYQALNGIGYATSADGINWTRRQTLFMTSDGVAWRSQSIWMPSVVKTGNNYEIYFLGSNNPDISDSDWIQWKLGRAILTPDTTPPRVISVLPANAAIDVAENSNPTATFSKALDPTTITNATFTLMQGNTLVTGTVTYAGVTATFTPTANLTASTVYTATITTGVKDLAGNALAANYSWSFTSAQSYTAWSDHGIIYTASTGNAYYPSVIFNNAHFGGTSSAPTYKMWYTDGNGGVFLITSSNGTTWSTPTTMLSIPSPGAYHIQVIYDANNFGLGATGPSYRMYYWTGTMDYSLSDIYTSQSLDGINWTNAVPITQNASAQLVTGAGTGWNRGSYGPVQLFYQPSAANTGNDPWNYSYVMYYDGTDGSMEETGLAYSIDGLYWEAYSGNPVLAASPSPAWDSNDAVYGTVYRDLEGFHYWYSGGVSSPDDGIGYAFSTNGEAWVKNTNPVLDIDDGKTYRDARTNTPSIIDDGTGVLKMYYTAQSTGGSKEIGLATLAISPSDTTPPTVIATFPINAAAGVAANSAITAVFSEALSPSTVTNATFTLMQGTTLVTGTVTYAGVTASFTPTANLAANTIYTATITNGVKDLAGNALSNNFVWSFTTGAPTGQSAVSLGSASTFIVLAGSIITNTGNSTISGDLGLSPGSTMTGFPPGIVIGTQHLTDSIAAQAQLNLTTAYNDVAGRTQSPITIAGNIGGQTLAPGLYKSASSLEISSGDLTLDAQGNANAIWIFQITTTLTTTSGRQVILSGGAQAANIYWQVGTSATLGTNSIFKGIILAAQSITLDTGATLEGRALAETGAVTLDTNDIVIAPTSSAAYNITSTGATLNGTVNPGDANTTVTFEYGHDTNYGTTGTMVTANQSPVSSGAGDTPVSAAVTGLTPGTLYYFRIVATNSEGTTYSGDQTFTVNEIDTTTSVSSSTNPSTYGNTVTFTATVNRATGTLNPSGTVDFKDGATTIASGRTLTTSGGGLTTATFTTASRDLTPGTNSITAVYNGDSSFNTSTSSAFSQVVNKAVLTVTGVSANNKVYDGNTTATLNIVGANLVGVVSGDTVTLDSSNYTAIFANKYVANGIDLTVSGLALGGAQASDYTLTQPIGLTASITAKTLTVTANSSSKTYGNTVTFAGTEFTTIGLINADTVTNVTLTSAGANPVTVPGIYNIVPGTAVGSGLGNYNITYNIGNLTVNPVITVTNAGAYGTISPSGAVTIPYGANQTFTFTPNPDCMIVNVIVDGNQQSPISNYTFTNVTANHTIAANFALIQVTTTQTTPTTTSTTSTTTTTIPTTTSTTSTTTTTIPTTTFTTSTTTPTIPTTTSTTSTTTTTIPVTLSQQVTTGPNLAIQTNVFLDSQGISQSGGQITTTDGEVSFNVAAGTQMLDAEGHPLTEIVASLPTSGPPPPPLGAIVAFYDFSPSGATFTPSLTLTLKYDPATLLSGVSPSTLYISYWDGLQWQKLTSTVDMVADTVTALVPHFTDFAVMGQTATAATTTMAAPSTHTFVLTWSLIIGIMAVIVIVVLLIYFFIARRHTGKSR